MDYKDFIANLHDEIPVGLSLESKKALYALDFAAIPREHRVELAVLSSRARYHFLGLRILSPVVVGEKSQLRDDATDFEEYEYCRLLRKVGATIEAQNRIQNVDFNRFPKAHLESAFCSIAHWRYEEAMTSLTVYSECKMLSDRERQEGLLLLLKAHVVAGNSDEVHRLSPEVLRWIEQSENEDLKTSFYSIMAEMALFGEDLEEFRHCLAQASHYLKSPFSLESIEIEKWQSVLQALDLKSFEPIEDFKSKAEVLQQFEALRDCDLLQIKMNFKPDLFRKLTYGTPFSTYHKRISRLLKLDIPMPDRSLLGPGQGPPLDIYFGEQDSQAVFNQGKDVHRLIYCLTSDLYRPWSLGALNQALFPNELFNVYTVPNKIHQLVHRARKELAKVHLDMEILERHNVYTIDFSKQDVVVDLNKKMPDSNEIILARVDSLFGDKPFTSGEVTEGLNQSKSATQRFLLWGVENGAVLKSKQGRQVYYQVNKAYKKVA